MTTTEIARNSRVSAAAQALANDDWSAAQYVEALEKHELFPDALQFHAHTLDPKGAIVWARKCVQELDPPEQTPASAPSVAAVDRWMAAPDDSSRWAAREAAQKSHLSLPADLLGMAVFLSGGSTSPAGRPETPPPEFVSQTMAGAGVLLAVVAHSPENRAKRYRRALELAGYKPPDCA